MNELGISSVETLLVSIPAVKDLDFAAFQPVWEAMEALYDNDTVYSLGVCDFNKEQLENLYDWAKVTTFTSLTDVVIDIVLVFMVRVMIRY